MAVSLNDHKVFDLHTAEITHAADVVTREIHEHDVFGAFLRVGEQFFFERQIFRLGFAARTRARNRTDFHFAFLAADVQFRRCADERKAIQLQQKHIRRRIRGTRGAVNIHRRRRDWR